MPKKRVLVGYGIDVDAVSGWINTKNGAPASATDVSRGIFGATIGVDRLLKLWEKYHIKTTWFVPAHTAESFEPQIKKIIEAGHEIGLHGYTHEHVSTLSAQQERDVLSHSIQVLTHLCGKKPKGWTAPAWDTSSHTVSLLEDFGIEYDHSFMHHDSQLYHTPHPPRTTSTNTSHPASSWMTPMSQLKPSKLITVPANWHLDDWPPFQLNLKQPSTHGFVDTRSIEQLWRDQFEYHYRENDKFVFPISIHPQVSGKPQVLLMHERFIEWVNGHEGVEWCTFEEMVREGREERMPVLEVEGGVGDVDESVSKQKAPASF